MSTIEKPEIKRSSLSTAKRIVIKVGSSLLTDLELGLNRGRISEYSAQIVELIDNDREVVLVSSGAIAEGCVRLGWAERPEEIAKLQQQLPLDRWDSRKRMKRLWAKWIANRP